MGATTDKILGRAKQAVGAITGNKKMKREGHVQEDKGELKDKFNAGVDTTHEALDDVKKTVNRT